MACRPLLLALSLLLWTGTAVAERAVYKNVDPSGKVTYSDRKNEFDDKSVKNWNQAHPGRLTYDSAIVRAESDRLYYARLLAERRQPAPVAIYDPRGWQAALTRPAYADGTPRRSQWDPNLPLSPRPSLERDYYYYNGR